MASCLAPPPGVTVLMSIWHREVSCETRIGASALRAASARGARDGRGVDAVAGQEVRSKRRVPLHGGPDRERIRPDRVPPRAAGHHVTGPVPDVDRVGSGPAVDPVEAAPAVDAVIAAPA